MQTRKLEKSQTEKSNHFYFLVYFIFETNFE